MNNLAKEWVKALRSGEYEQGRGYLCANGAWCCLGVLHDIAHDGYWYSDGDSVWFAETGHPTPAAFPPPPTMNAVGLSYRQATRLAKMNDTGRTFDEIADEIERMLK